MRAVVRAAATVVVAAATTIISSSNSSRESSRSNSRSSSGGDSNDCNGIRDCSNGLRPRNCSQSMEQLAVAATTFAAIAIATVAAMQQRVKSSECRVFCLC